MEYLTVEYAYGVWRINCGEHGAFVDDNVQFAAQFACEHVHSDRDMLVARHVIDAAVTERALQGIIDGTVSSGTAMAWLDTVGGVA